MLTTFATICYYACGAVYLGMAWLERRRGRRWRAEHLPHVNRLMDELIAAHTRALAELPANVYPGAGHPWDDFVNSRNRLIRHWLVRDQRPPEAVLHDLSLTVEQVRSIALKPLN